MHGIALDTYLITFSPHGMSLHTQILGQRVVLCMKAIQMGLNCFVGELKVLILGVYTKMFNRFA